MKKVIGILCALLVLSCMAGCGPVKENITIAYDEPYTLENAVFEKYDALEWSSEDPSVAVVQNGVVTGKNPGTTVVSVQAKDKVIAVYTVTVEIIPIKGIVLSTNECEITQGETLQIHYTLFPENASDYGLKWKSANESVATVSNRGLISAKETGQTTISISNEEGFVATCSVKVSKAKPNLKAIYEANCAGKNWAYINAEGTYMTVDTNPNNRDDYTDFGAYFSLAAINKALGLPDSVYEKMGSTRAMDGRQSQSYNSVTVSWTYHPDHGLEVVYEIN